MTQFRRRFGPILALLATTLQAVNVGDAGHYLMGDTRIYVRSESGEAFDVTLQRFEWWIGAGWNRRDLQLKVTAPDLQVIVDQTVVVGDDGGKVRVPASGKGVYTIDVDPRNTLNYWYLTTSLDQAVAWTGPATGEALASRWFVCAPFVSRCWYFWVPPGTKRFTVRAQNNSGRSQREDHGITVVSPRGQRQAVLWGQASPEALKVPAGDKAYAEQRADILVEPGCRGHFWGLTIRAGDSHIYSDINVALEGVPPYLAMSPETWFDPDHDARPSVPLYDDDEFVQSDRTTTARAADPLHQHWTPAPAMGDPDSDELRCPATIALWNPEGRELKLVIGTYLPRGLFPDAAAQQRYGSRTLPPEAHDHAAVRLYGADGSDLLEARVPLLHLHHGDRWEQRINTGAGVATLDVTAAEHFWLYTYPATPIVMVGEAVADWRRFRFEIGTARNWYFFVPPGTDMFRVRVRAEAPTDVVALTVNTPTQTMAMIYDHAGELAVRVPPGAAGCIWHLRCDVGEPTIYAPRAAAPRFPSLNLVVDLAGVPGYLAPTWAQWFDPRDPKPPTRRTTSDP